MTDLDEKAREKLDHVAPTVKDQKILKTYLYCEN